MFFVVPNSALVSLVPLLVPGLVPFVISGEFPRISKKFQNFLFPEPHYSNDPTFLVTMETPCVTLRTKERTNLLSGDEFEGVTDVELEILLQKSRDTVVSLEAELERRQLLTASNHSKEITGYCDSLRKGFDKIRVLERLDVKAAEHVKTAVEILKTPQTSRSFKVYETFLQDVLRHCGPELVLLCAACLGKPKVSSLKKEDRVALLDHLKTKKLSYVSPILGRLATEYGIHSLHSEQGQSKVQQGPTALPSRPKHVLTFTT